MSDLFQKVIDHYVGIGYTERHDFPGEYVLLVNPETIESVRVYTDGDATDKVKWSVVRNSVGNPTGNGEAEFSE